MWQGISDWRITGRCNFDGSGRPPARPPAPGITPYNYLFLPRISSAFSRFFCAKLVSGIRGLRLIVEPGTMEEMEIGDCFSKLLTEGLAFGRQGNCGVKPGAVKLRERPKRSRRFSYTFIDYFGAASRVIQ